MAFDLVIFDCDGVLIDSELLACRAVATCLAADGIAVSAKEILDRYTGISWAGMVADLETRHGPMAADFADRHRQLLWPLLETELQPIPGVAEVLDALECKVCVGSSGRPDRLRHALSVVRLFERLHPHIFSATEVARGKPAPDLFLHAAERMGVAPRDCAVVEDSLPGIEAAVAAGMTAIGFTGGSHCEPGLDSRLRDAGAIIVIENMSSLVPDLARLRP